MKLGMKLRLLRRTRTLAEVGEACNLSVSHLSDIERDRAMPSLDVLATLAALYGVSLSELFADVTIGLEPASPQMKSDANRW